jgi:hypothetical protein
MGAPYNKRLQQWSKGDYTGANEVSVPHHTESLERMICCCMACAAEV